MFDRLNSYGFCLSSKRKYSLDEIGEHFMDHAVELVKKGHKFVFVLDNIDWTVQAHDMRADNQNRSVHAVATSLVFDRVPQVSVVESNFKQSLATTDIVKLVTENDKKYTRYRVILGRLICEFLPAFHHFKNLVPNNTICDYEEEMKLKSVVILFPVMMKDEKKYAELVDVLDQLEQWNQELFSKAGLCSSPDFSNTITPQPLVATTSRPDHPASHIPPVLAEDDPLPKIPCYGDQLSRVRMAGCKDLRAGNPTGRERLDHIYPFRIVDWHTKRSFLKVSIFCSLNVYPRCSL